MRTVEAVARTDEGAFLCAWLVEFFSIRDPSTIPVRLIMIDLLKSCDVVEGLVNGEVFSGEQR